MKKVFLFIILFLLTGCALQKSVSTVEINNKIFQVELAQSAQEHYQGLSGRQSLAEDKAMLFVFDDYAQRTFVMRDMSFPLDIIWIKDNQVIGCEKSVPILDVITYEISQVISSEPVNYALEVNAGLCDKYNIKTNDWVDINVKE